MEHTRLSDARVPRAGVFASISSIIAGADGDPSTLASEPTIIPYDTRNTISPQSTKCIKS